MGYFHFYEIIELPTDFSDERIQNRLIHFLLQYCHLAAKHVT